MDIRNKAAALLSLEGKVAIISGGVYDEQYREECSARHIARLGTPEDVANVVLFLASDMSSWITGAHIVVDGGGIA